MSMLLITLLMGIIEFGYAFFLQGNIAGAAREAARAHAITGDPAAALAAATGIPPGANIDVGVCSPGAPVTVTITYQYDGLTGFFPGYTMEGQGVMRCGG
ncbi:pilus assembly protein [Tessaracoccus sp. MC1865]|nr:pilus assembly protein [Tessaracoccus sp. MC1865]